MASTSSICTLFEGDYHLGVAALINSLHTAGFTGTVVCGCRGKTPPWSAAAMGLERMQISFVEITTPLHLTNYKPGFLQACWDGIAATADQLFYVDPDIVVKAPWPTLDRWARDGLAVCEDVNSYLPARHPYRLAWLDFFSRNGIVPARSLDRYYNAGFFGVPRTHRGLLDEWQRLLDLAEAELGPLNRIKSGAPHELFHTIDQDAFNMALLLNDLPINAAGPEAMDFFPGGHLLSHAAGGTKPWRGGFLKEALRGRPPGLAQKCFHQHLDGPLPVLPLSVVRSRRLELGVAALIGRFYRRT
jgi:hypothetical protein